MKTGKKDIYKNLDEHQIQAVTAPIDRPVVVLAGPGSGKTRVLAHRIAWMIENNIDPQNILAVTFSTSAAAEILSRAVLYSTAEQIEKVEICTIHAFCRRLLETWNGNVEKVEDWKVAKEIKDTCKKLSWNIGWRKIKWWIERAKNCGISYTKPDLLNFYLGEIPNISLNDAEKLIECFFAVMDLFEQEDFANEVFTVTFPDMLNLVWQELSTDKESLSKVQKQYPYILIDEGQDTSELSMRILRLICPKLFIVGDSDQTLFRFAGSSPEDNLYRLADAGAEVIKLNNNYRSGPEIVKRANKLISCNYGLDIAKYQKSLVSARKFKSQVAITSYLDAEEEAGAVVDKIQLLMLDGYKEQDFYVAARTNAQLAFCERELAVRGIKYAVPGANGFFDRHHIVDIVSYLKLTYDPSDDRAFEKVYNIASTSMIDMNGDYIPHRYLGRRFLSECNSRGKTLLAGAKKIYQLSDSPYRVGLKDLLNFLEQLNQKTTTTELVEYILENCYLKHYQISSGSAVADPGDDDNVLEDLKSLLALAEQYPELDSFLEMVANMQKLAKPQRGRYTQIYSSVVLATIHKLKGRERPIVFGIGWSEGLLPHRRALSVEEEPEALAIPNFSSIQDERCAAYVCMTRAQDQLYLSSIQQWNGQELQPSRFLKELR